MKRAFNISVLISSLLLFAAAVSAKETWVRVRTKNFTLVSNAGESKARKVAVELEQFRYALSLLFPKARIETPVPTTVFLFKSDDSFTPFKPKYKGKIKENVGGYFVSTDDGNYIALASDARGSLGSTEIIFHEYEHFVVRNNVSGAPLWLNEGLAEFYSTFSPDGERKASLGTPISRHIMALRQSYVQLPLEKLLAVDHKSPYYNESSKAGIFYAKSWALVHYLMLGHDGRRKGQLGQFINGLGTGVPLEENFRQSFKADYKTIEGELDAYVKKFLFPGLTITFNEQLDFAKEAQAAPLTEAESQFHLGDLLLHSNRPEDAEAYLLKSLELDNSIAAARVSLASVRLTQQRLPEAISLLREAVAKDPNDYSGHYHYANALLFNRQHEEALAEYRSAIRLKPDAPQVYFIFARALESIGRDEEAAEAFTKGLDLNPRNTRMFRSRSYLFLRMGRNAAAASDALMFLRRQGWRDDQSPYMALAAYLGLLRSRQSAPAARLLEDVPARLDASQWPYPVIRFLRREITKEELLKLATDNDKLTEAHAYVGLYLSLSGETDSALPHLRWVGEHGNKNFVEYPLALAEMKRLEAEAGARAQ
ncbi:MAG: tetratricopeptide repeat protein [Rubrivivax sp.]|nr:tetratricopeptide repeat protein [Pyrinomonadaceae bacterium]